MGVGMAVAVAAAAFFWREARDLRAEHAALRQSVYELEAKARLAPAPLAAVAQGADAEERQLELLRLRNEVTKLRAERKERSGGGSSALDEGSRVARENWAFSGYSSPEAALLTGLAAIRDGQLPTLLESLAPDARRSFEARNRTNSEAEIAGRIQKAVAEVTGVRVLGQHEYGEDVMLDVYLEGTGRMGKYQMAQGRDGEWKFAGLFDPSFTPLPPQPAGPAMTYYIQNPELMKRYFPQMYEMMQQQRQQQPQQSQSEE